MRSHPILLTGALLALCSVAIARQGEYDLRFVAAGTPVAVNDLGDVVFDEGGRAWFAASNGSLEVLPLPAGASSSLGHGLNDLGTVVGQASGAGIGSQGVVWRRDEAGGWTVELVPTGSPFDSDATAVNDLDDVIGWYQGGGTYVYNEVDGFVDLTDFVPLGFGPAPSDVNNRRQVVGRNLFGRATLVDFPARTWEELPLPVGTGASYQAIDANGLNDEGDLCGRGVVATAGPNDDQALRYDAGTDTWSALNDPVPQAAAIDLDARGNTLFAVGFTSPVLMHFVGEGTFDLEDLLVPSASGWSLGFPAGLSDDGLVVCAGFAAEGTSGVVVLTPRRSPVLLRRLDRGGAAAR